MKIASWAYPVHGNEIGWQISYACNRKSMHTHSNPLADQSIKCVHLYSYYVCKCMHAWWCEPNERTYILSKELKDMFSFHNWIFSPYSFGVRIKVIVLVCCCSSFKCIVYISTVRSYWQRWGRSEKNQQNNKNKNKNQIIWTPERAHRGAAVED